MDVDPIQKRAREPLLITGDNGRLAGALLNRVLHYQSLQKGAKVAGTGLQAPLSGLMAFLVGSTLAVNQMEFRLCRLSAKRGYYGRATLIHH